MGSGIAATPDFLERPLQIAVAQAPAVPFERMRHERDALSFDRLRQDAGRLLLHDRNGAEYAQQLADIVPVDRDDGPAERAEFVGEGLERADIFRARALLRPVS